MSSTIVLNLSNPLHPSSHITPVMPVSTDDLITRAAVTDCHRPTESRGRTCENTEAKTLSINRHISQRNAETRRQSFCLSLLFCGSYGLELKLSKPPSNTLMSNFSFASSVRPDNYVTDIKTLFPL